MGFQIKVRRINKMLVGNIALLDAINAIVLDLVQTIYLGNDIPGIGEAGIDDA